MGLWSLIHNLTLLINTYLTPQKFVDNLNAIGTL